jgi:cytochrome P450
LEHQRLRGWIVSGYHECETVLRSTHSSVDRSETLQIFRPYSQLEPDVLEFFATWLIGIDPPDHTRLRKLVSRAFTPRSVEALEPEIRRIADTLLDDVERHSHESSAPVDLMASYANVLPIQVIGTLLGIPAADWPWLKTVSDDIARFVDPITGFDAKVMNASVRELSDYFVDLLEQRRTQPSADLTGRLLEAEEAGDRLTRSELISMVALVMGAGHETTTGLIGNALVAVDANPAARTLLLTRPDLDDNAVEEFLRYDSPVQATQRTLTAPLEVGGFVIPAGADVSVMLAAANRDPIEFDRPDELLLDRPDPRPLSFGSGIHHCVGAALARMEGRVAITSFVRRFPGFTIDESTIEWKSTVTLRGPNRLPAHVG